MERTDKVFNPTTLVMIVVAVIINMGMGEFVARTQFGGPEGFKLPLYLDSIGTVVVAILAGPWVGALTGLITNLVWGLSGINPAVAAFAAVAATTGLLAGLFAENGWFRVWWRVIVAGLIAGIVTSAFAAPIAYYVFGGETGGGTDFVVSFFAGLGYDQMSSTFMQGFTSDPVDKAVTFLIAWGIVRLMPAAFRARFPRAEKTAPAVEADAAVRV